MTRGAARAAFVDRAIARIKDIPPSVDVFGEDCVRGSLASGAAGVAFFLHEAARLREAALMERADGWTAAAEQWAHEAGEEAWRGTPCAHLLGRGGLATTRILVSSSLGDSRGVARGFEMLAGACARVRDQARLPAALFDGAAGLLCALRYVRVSLGREWASEAARLEEDVWPVVAEHLSSPLGGDGAHLGLGHGIAGELWCAATWWPDGTPLPAFLLARVTELLEVAEEDETAIVWPCAIGEEFGDALSAYSVCHGTSGHALLWAALHRRGVEPAGRVIERIGRTMCLLGPSPHPTVCCGLAGQSIAHRRLSAHLPRVPHERRALARILRAAVTPVQGLLQPEGPVLWFGSLGVALVAMLEEAGESQLPCLEPPSIVGGWVSSRLSNAACGAREASSDAS